MGQLKVVPGSFHASRPVVWKSREKRNVKMILATNKAVLNLLAKEDSSVLTFSNAINQFVTKCARENLDGAESAVCQSQCDDRKMPRLNVPITGYGSHKCRRRIRLFSEMLRQEATNPQKPSGLAESQSSGTFKIIPPGS